MIVPDKSKGIESTLKALKFQIFFVLIALLIQKKR